MRERKFVLKETILYDKEWNPVYDLLDPYLPIDKIDVIDNLRVETQPVCNLHCDFCFMDDPKFYRDPDLLKEPLLKICNKCRWIHFGYGEPLFNPLYLYALENMQDSSILDKVNINTNGTLLDRALFDRLQNIRDKIQFNISVDASNEDSYLKMRKGGSWSKVSEALDLVSEYYRSKNRKNTLGFIICKNNFRDIPEFMKICRDKNFRCHMMMPMQAGVYRVVDDMFTDFAVHLESNIHYKELISILNSCNVSMISGCTGQWKVTKDKLVLIKGNNGCCVSNDLYKEIA